MKKTNFQRLTALLLCLMFVLGCFTLPLAAAKADSSEGSGTSSSVTGQTLADIRELLNAISYEEYSALYVGVPGGKETIVIDAANKDVINSDKTNESDYEIIGDDETKEEMAKYGLKEGEMCIATGSTGSVSWNVNIPTTGKYIIQIEYYATEGKAASIERILQINDKVPFSEARYLKLHKNWENDYIDAIYNGKVDWGTVKADAKAAGVECYEQNGQLKFKYPEVWTKKISELCDKYSLRFMKIDVYGNELRPEAYQAPEWTTYTVKDSAGYHADAFEFVFEAGTSVITLEGENEPMAIKSITLCPVKTVESYADYIAKYKGTPQGKDVIKLEGEYTASATDKTIYAIEDRSSAANSPCASDRTLLNTMGAEKWQTAGQCVTYTFSVSSSGMYDIVTRFRQNVLDGIFVNRALYIYSEGLNEGERGYYNGLPFAEAAALTYNYGDEWQVTNLKAQDAEGNEKSFNLYFAAGVTYTLKFEVTLGALGEIINDVQDALDAINDDYLTILRLTGTTPDSNRDYKFSSVMPDQLIDMVRQAQVLDNDDKDNLGVAQKLTALAGQKSSHVGTLQKVADLLREMGRDEDQIARNLARLKSYIGTLGTFLSDVKTQPLQIDYMMIQSSSQEMPIAKATFWKTLVHEVKSFFWSFFRDYDGMGVMNEETVGEGVEVWLATGRDQSQVIRNLVNNDFTPSSKANGDEVDGCPVDLKLVAVGTLLPSILAGEGPDVYLGLAQADVINYAIRSAVYAIEDMEGFDEHMENFTESAKLVVGIEDANGIQHYYGLPEAQGFLMMFVRIDVLADLGIEVPKTWDDIMAAIPVLQSKNMEIGLTPDFQIFLYQSGGSLFADDGMRINLDSKKGLSAFERTCNLFTQYGFPYVYDAANRFRTGEMPIIVSDYTGLYNQLKVFATEIDGLWQFVPLPGTVGEDGTINNCSVSSITATVMVKGCDSASDQAKAWQFMKWYTGKQCQADYSNEMVAIMGPSAKYNTANRAALAELPWTTEEYMQVSAQFENLAAVPNYPGAYIIGRYTNFAFLSAYNEKADPVESLMSYINTINKEITRKREEFGLETLEIGQTLKDKRRDQSKEAVEALKKAGLADVAELADKALRTADDAIIKSAAEEIAAMVKTKIDTIKVSVKKDMDLSDLTNDELLYYTSQALYDTARAQE